MDLDVLWTKITNIAIETLNDKDFLTFTTEHGILYCLNDGVATKITTSGGPTPQKPWSKFFRTHKQLLAGQVRLLVDYVENRTVDIIPLSPDQKEVFLIRRKDKGGIPGGIALPGGHIDPPELPVEAAYRELGEETLELPNAIPFVQKIEQVSGWVREKPTSGRDTAEHVSITLPFIALMKPEAVGLMRGSDDAMSGQWYDVQNVPWEDFHFGHHIDILKEAVLQ